MEKFLKKDSGMEFNYIVIEPKNMDKAKKYPLFVFLHGAGEREDESGVNVESVLAIGLPKLFLADENIPAVMVAPQCPKDEIWDINTKDLKKFLDKIIEKYPVDEDKVVLTGNSMGGYGTWSFATTYPDMLAGIAPVCGGGIPWRLYGINNMPVKLFHGDADPIVPVVESYKMADQLIRQGANPAPELTIFHNVGHNAWDYAYTKDLLEWFFTLDRRNRPTQAKD